MIASMSTLLAAGEEVGREVAVLGPRVEREVALGDDRDAGDAVRRELVHEHVDEGDVAGRGRGPQRVLGPLDGVEVRRTPELADRVPTDPESRPPSPPPYAARCVKLQADGARRAPGG